MIFENSDVRTIDSFNLKTKISNGEKIRIIDVCEPIEYSLQNIENSVNVPLGNVEYTFENNLLNIAPEEEIILYCAHGYRSLIGAEILQSMGFNNVYSLEGGIESWFNS